ncbi:hypothetical protein QA601_18855 [Chitinispirillales bacterium ANBcel5]|uniref:hypothetical protein n=1 Tax=Cellulosispirillum alkaliphilum TaxID=3039283 RepID=UPI002A4FB343|nr:hypothetical protein [Chitinispirillales bacterium ANBcel5]
MYTHNKVSKSKKMLIFIGAFLVFSVNCKNEHKAVSNGEIGEVNRINETVIAIGTAIKEELYFIDETSERTFEKVLSESVVTPVEKVFMRVYSKVTFKIDTIFGGEKYDTLIVYFHLPDPLGIEMGLKYMFKAKRGDFALVNREKCLYPDSFYIVRRGYHERTTYHKTMNIIDTSLLERLIELP